MQENDIVRNNLDLCTIKLDFSNRVNSFCLGSYDYQLLLFYHLSSKVHGMLISITNDFGKVVLYFSIRSI